MSIELGNLAGVEADELMTSQVDGVDLRLETACIGNIPNDDGYLSDAIVNVHDRCGCQFEVFVVLGAEVEPPLPRPSGFSWSFRSDPVEGLESALADSVLYLPGEAEHLGVGPDEIAGLANDAQTLAHGVKKSGSLFCEVQLFKRNEIGDAAYNHIERLAAQRLQCRVECLDV